MKRKNKITLGIVGLATVALFASGCTANFSTDKEKAKIAYAFEPGISLFVTDTSVLPEGDGNVHRIVLDVPESPTLKQVYWYVGDESGIASAYKVCTLKDDKYVLSDASQLNSVINSAYSSSIAVPYKEYFATLDLKVLRRAVAEYNANQSSDENKIDLASSTIDVNKVNESFKYYGYVKYYANNSAFENYRVINREIRNEKAGDENSRFRPSMDFENYYIDSMNSLVDSYRSTITVYDMYEYGNYNGKQIKLDRVTWPDAWGKGGHLIEGLIVYPVAWMIDSFAHAFAGGKNATPEAVQKQYLSGVPQILSILVVTVIVRMFIFLCTFKSTLAQKKMSELQPELAKIQQKYPNANTNQAQKQRLAEEQMRLYKKHKVNPLSQLLVLVIQFPIFIGVWGAMTGSAVLSTGTFLGLDLSASIWATLKVGPKVQAGWWTALILIVLMSVAQFFSMKVPQWIQKAKTKKVARLGKNPAQKQQNRTANIVSYVMLIMIIVMGFTLPAAMGVYWFVGAIVSLIQTVFTNVIFAGNKKNK